MVQIEGRMYRFSGYTMERPGPPAFISGLSRPIPNGLYNTCPRESQNKDDQYKRILKHLIQ